MEEKVCKICRIIISKGDRCPICGSTDLTTKWSGYIMMTNVENSDIAKKLNIKLNGTFALNIKQ
ncbi:MAG: transcription elongation factor subunit Spt4 [Candidatus Micrarchaeaceae archaeon]